MILIPREKPVVENLNSYYLDINKLIEHYQGEVGAGVVHFLSPGSEAVLFFDEQNIINGFFKDRKKQQFHGAQAVDLAIQSASRNSFTVSVYRVLPERLCFWANLPRSKEVYKDLTTEFTNLEGLIRKMESEKFTGYIDVEVNNGHGGLLFIYDGEVIGGSHADGAGNVDRSIEYRQDLIRRSKELGGRFNVNRVLLDEEKVVAAQDGKPAGGMEKPHPGLRGESLSGSGDADPARILEMLGVLLAALESEVRSSRKIRSDFETLLNRKFVEKVDRYEFLDPFAAEFKYAGGKIQFTGRAENRQLVEAIAECVLEIAEAHALLGQLRNRLDAWRKEFNKEINAFDLTL